MDNNEPPFPVFIVHRFVGKRAIVVSLAFAKGMPPGTEMWHKFGEWSSPGLPYELHESGIFYYHGVPYLLTVMTRGKDYMKLPKVIQAVAGRVYTEIPQP